MISGTSLIQILSEVKPTEIYNLGAMSHVKISFQTAEYTADVDGVGTLRLLEAIRTVGMNDKEFLKNVRKISPNYFHASNINLSKTSKIHFDYRSGSTKHLPQSYMERLERFHRMN